MAFDIAEYSAAMDEFVLKMEKLDSEIHPEIPGAIGRVCRALRIAKLEYTLYEMDRGAIVSEGKSFTAYASGVPDNERAHTIKETTGNGSIVVYGFYPRSGAEDWSPAELERITILEKTLFTFLGKIRTSKFAEQLLYHDADLDIHSLNYMMRALGPMIAKGEAVRYGACYFNLKSFSLVNSQLGRRAGTGVMKAFVHGLQDLFGGRGFVFRIGGDNFGALFPKECLEQVKEYLCGTIINVEHTRQKRVNISAHAGYYMIDDECKTPADVMDKISAAANIAKKTPNTPYVFFDNAVRHRVEDMKMVEGLFPGAIENEEFLVYYQPKVRLNDYTLIGAEALCRWKHDGEIIAPFRFIPILERGRNICTLDFYMLEHVCRDIRKWLDEGRRVVTVSVNLSRVHLGDMDLLDRIIKIIDKYSVPHQYIEIELTETTTDVDFTELKKVVSGLNIQGIRTSVDDFGIGYSSLNLIRELPWNTLKIDKSFLPSGNEEEAQRKCVLLKYLIAMAQNLGLECIAEGVETIDQIALLKENNCFNAQGFYFDKPLPAEEFSEKLL